MKISTLLFLCALALSSVAAYYSIIGLATIFSASFWAVVIMAAILEVSKLVCASWLYQKWHKINALIKIYLTSAVVVLMLITSLGIFGFLSRAHVDQQLGNTEVTLKIEQVDAQIVSIKEVMDRYRSQLTQLDRAINIQLDANRATQALAARQRQVAERDQIRQKLDSEQQNLQKLEQNKMELKQKISVLESEVGPIKYVAEFFVQNNKVDVEKAVRWMIVVIVLVFDPLAVLMLIAANMSLIKEREEQSIVLTKDSNAVILNNSEPQVVQQPIPTDHLAGSVNLRYDFKSRRLVYFNGADWIPTELGLINSLPNDSAKFEKMMIDAVVDALNQNNVNQQVTLEVDLSKIQAEVKSAMDAWLTSTTHDIKSTHDVRKDESNTDASITDVAVTVIPMQDTSTSNVASESNQPAVTSANLINEKNISWI